MCSYESIQQLAVLLAAIGRAGMLKVSPEYHQQVLTSSGALEYLRGCSNDRASLARFSMGFDSSIGLLCTLDK